MIKHLTAAIILAATSTLAFAQAEKADTGSLSNKAKEAPASGSGSTETPTAKPKDGSLSDKASKDQPGSTGGSPGTSGSPAPTLDGTRDLKDTDTKLQSGKGALSEPNP